MPQQISPQAAIALKDALTSVYWYKSDLRSFLQVSIGNHKILATINWDNYKRQIVSDIVDGMIAKPDAYIGDLLKLCGDVSKMRSFRHLEQLDGGIEKARLAKEAVEALRKMLEPHEEAKAEQARIMERQRVAKEKLLASNAVREKLELLKRKYFVLVSSQDKQGRGYELEKLMYELFDLFDLDPKASFKVTGEQIDGAFALDGTDYLFEAKWHASPIDAAGLDAFSNKVRRKLENTLGLYLSINGFTRDGVQLHTAGRSVMLLMDGADLMAVLEERIDFVSLILRKKRHASRTGRIYIGITEILGEETQPES